MTMTVPMVASTYLKLKASTLIKTDPFSLTKRDPSDAQERAWCAVKVVVEKVNALACEGLTERI
jgi:hypothetical protein